jgi:hypothetical protein
MPSAAIEQSHLTTAIEHRLKRREIRVAGSIRYPSAGDGDDSVETLATT